MNTENSKTNEPHRIKLDLTDKLNLKNSNQKMALSSLSIYYIQKNVKLEYNNNKFEISAPTWNDTFSLRDGSYSIADTQDYFEFIIKRHETLTENLLIQICPNKLKNKIVFKIKTGYKLETLTPETMRLLGTAKIDVNKDKDGENLPNQNLLRLFQFIVIQSKMIINTHQKLYLLLFQIINLDS